MFYLFSKLIFIFSLPLGFSTSSPPVSNAYSTVSGGEEGTPMKHPKPASSVQEVPIATDPFPDRTSSMQAHYGGASPAAFNASTVASPSPHLYMWGSQHHCMSPLGNPMPYPALFPPGGTFTHPAVPMVTGSTCVGNDGPTLSSGSGVDGSSDASKENTHDDESAIGKKRNIHQILADGSSAQDNKATTPGNPVVPIPASNPSEAVAPGEIIVDDGTMHHPLVHDEREVKKQKRKQSNRESARRSRLRKQAECEDLQGRVYTLNKENHILKKELQRLSEECEKVTSENQSIKDELAKICGPDDLTRD